MQILMILALFTSFGGDAPAGDWVSLGGDFNGAPQLTILEENADHVTVELDLAGYSVQNTMGYARYSVPDYGYNLDTPVGNPELPMVSVVLGIPAGMTPELTSVETNWEAFGSGRPYPAQPLRYDCDDEPYLFAELSTDLQGTYPEDVCAFHAQGTWAGVNTVVLQVNPFRWNAETGEFSVSSSVTARIDFTGTREYQHSVRPEIASMHRSRIVNYESLGIPVDASPVSMDDIVYICVVPAANLESVTPLLAMVNSIGHHVHIIEMDEGSTSYMIKSAINSVYQPGVTRFAVIPARHQQLESKAYSGFVGDFYYECLDADNLPDIAVGRYPGNYTQLENQTAKTMSYITYTGQAGEPSVPASVVLSAHQEDYPNKYTANSEAVKNWSYSLADPVFHTIYPPEGGTAEQLEGYINADIGIVNYRGHGSNTTWQWSPGWNAGSIYGLTNTVFPPVFNVCCSNGAHNHTYNCLSESWMDGPGVGASGNLGASAPSLTTVNNRMQRVLFWEIFDEGNTCAGEMFAASQTDIIQTQGGGGLNNSRMYHWFGDPSMDIPNSDEPGAPFAMAIDAPDAVNAGDNNVTLTVTSGGSPVEGAVVTVTDGIGNHASYPESFYEQQITNSSGEAVISFTALEGKDLYYGVRKHNYGSITGTIDVTTEGIEGDVQGGVSISPITPSPASSSASVTFSAPSGSPVTLSLLDISGRVVTTLVDQQSSGGENTLGFSTSEFTPGIYFVVLRCGGVSITEKMAIVR